MTRIQVMRHLRHVREMGLVLLETTRELRDDIGRDAPEPMHTVRRDLDILAGSLSTTSWYAGDLIATINDNVWIGEVQTMDKDEQSRRDTFTRWLSDPETWVGVFENQDLSSSQPGHRVGLCFDMETWDDAHANKTSAPDHPSIGLGWRYILIGKFNVREDRTANPAQFNRILADAVRCLTEGVD